MSSVSDGTSAAQTITGDIVNDTSSFLQGTAASGGKWCLSLRNTTGYWALFKDDCSDTYLQFCYNTGKIHIDLMSQK